MINDEVMDLIISQFRAVMESDVEYYSRYTIHISNEQQYINTKNRDSNDIFIVVKMLPATINFGQTVLPVNFNCIAEQNKIEVCQKLLLEYAQTYNLATNADETIKQFYTSPSNASNFNEMFVGFRSVFFMSGTFLISYNSNPFRLYYVTENESNQKVETLVDCISNSFNFTVQNDSQPFYQTNNFTKSVSMIGIFTLNFTTYLTDDDVLNKILDIASQNMVNEPAGINSNFVFTLRFKNGKEISEKIFKIVDFSVQENIGELPIASVSFTN